MIANDTWASYHDEATRIARRRAQARSRDRWAALRAFGYVAAVCLLLAMILSAGGCSGVHPTPEFEQQVLDEIAATAADLDEWAKLTDAQQQAAYEACHRFALDVAAEIGLDVPPELRR